MPTKHTTIRSDVGPRGVFNPNYVPAQGTWWDPETGRGGMPAPPAPSAKEAHAAKVFNDALIREFDIHAYLAANPAEGQSVGEAVAQLRQAGKSPEAAVKEVVGIIRASVPGFAVRPADERVWRANLTVAQLEANRPKGIFRDGR